MGRYFQHIAEDDRSGAARAYPRADGQIAGNVAALANRRFSRHHSCRENCTHCLHFPNRSAINVAPEAARLLPLPLASLALPLKGKDAAKPNTMSALASCTPPQQCLARRKT